MGVKVAIHQKPKRAVGENNIFAELETVLVSIIQDCGLGEFVVEVVGVVGIAREGNESECRDKADQKERQPLSGLRRCDRFFGNFAVLVQCRTLPAINRQASRFHRLRKQGCNRA